MHTLNVVTNSICAGLGGLADMLCGCAHRRTTFPITLRAALNTDGRQSGPLETYIVCLSCGRHLAYDWAAMRVVRRQPAQVVYPAAEFFAPESPTPSRTP
jgi:hypothetical protein